MYDNTCMSRRLYSSTSLDDELPSLSDSKTLDVSCGGKRHKATLPSPMAHKMQSILKVFNIQRCEHIHYINYLDCFHQSLYLVGVEQPSSKKAFDHGSQLVPFLISR